MLSQIPNPSSFSLKTMQLISTLSAHNININYLRAKRNSLRNRVSPLNPNARTVAAFDSSVSTRTHLSNLEKLLQTQTRPEPAPVQKPENKGRGILHNFNFEKIWPESKAAEEMSPRHLVRLQRLLSMSAEQSPRNNLGRQWREYHGSNDWEGLLDPLDENLRRELIRYGEFVQAAYHCFNTDPATSAGDVAGETRPVALPDRSYRVTKGLYATSAVGLPGWVDDVAPDLGWMTQRTSWVGYVAVCDDEREIARMGRREIVIALRGTATCLEWAENMRDLLVQVSEDGDSCMSSASGQAKVECGFLSLFKTCGASVPSLSEIVVQEVKRLMALYKGETLSISVTGHSLGAALSLLVADEISTCAKEVPPVAVFSFGGPRVGNKSFANRISEKNVKVLRVVNSQDVITRVPGMFASEGLDRTLRNSSIVAPMLNALDNNMPWAYAHVGTELRVETKKSPFLKPDADMACCHDLEAYLHLVDGFSSSNCPFRSNAKRSLIKLLNEQRSNVKKLYTSKAKSLRLSVEGERFSMTSCLPSPS